MKAIYYEEYGTPEVLQLRDLPTPVPGPTDLLVRVRAAALNPLDWHSLRGEPFIIRMIGGLRAPKQKTPGRDWAGVVEAVGADVTDFHPGDNVFGEAAGACAEYLVVPAARTVPLPPGVTHEQAAAAPVAALTALQALRDKGHLKPGGSVLINGASGGVGTYAVQIAKSLGADVTAVCSTKNLELVVSLGANTVIDYTKEDFTRSSARFDVILDAVGNRSLGECKRLLTEDGIYVAIAGSPSRIVRLMLPGRKRMVSMVTSSKREDLVTVADMLAKGEIASVIDRRYPLAETPEAVRYLGTGRARGKVIITP